MKSLAIISIISAVFLSGCAHYGYQRSYVGYGGGYSSGYAVQSSYAYPSSGYYRQSTVPAYSRHYSPPRYDRGGRHYDWDTSRQDRHHDMRNMERRLDRQQHAIRQGVRSGDLTRREAERLQQDAGRMDRKLDRAQRNPRVSETQTKRLQYDLNRSQQRIRQFKNNDLTNGARSARQGGGRDGHERGNRKR